MGIEYKNTREKTRFAATRVFEGSAKTIAPLDDSGRGETKVARIKWH
jgi:hypothetical protein